jgi:Prokaryotic lipoprotein-attachment site
LRALLAAALVALVVGCGIKGPPRPVDATVPPEVVDVPDAGCCKDAPP